MYLIIVIIMFIACPVFAATNLLQNPGFESGNSGSWQVEGVAANGVAKDNTPLPQAYFQPARVVAHLGDYAAFNLTANFKRIGSTFSQEIDVLPETSYRVGFSCLHGHPSQQVKIYPQILIDGKPIGSLTVAGGKGYGTTTADYQQISGEFVTRQQARARVSFVLNAGGLALTGMSYDDFFVVCSQAAVNISPTAGIPGTNVCLSGWNFQSGEQVDIEPINTNITTNENGAFSTTFTIPAHTSGTLTITATGAASGRIARLLFYIIPRGDYGDAPNSGIYPMNTGYFCKPDDFPNPLFLIYPANFPIISHKTVSEECLGKGVSLEAGVNDVSYDGDGVPNIEPYKARANQDSDDGLILPVDLIPGATNTVQFEVTLSPEASEARRYVNILFDWNQDGKWAGNEWAVKNQGVAVPAGESRVITSQEFLAGTNTGGCWMRLVLTREPVVGTIWDGGGEFEYGESEDYLLNIAPRCDLWIKCSVPEQVQLGQVITCHLEYGNQGQALANGVRVVMNIPQGLTCLNDTAEIKDNSLIWQIGNLYPGQQCLLEASLRVEPWGGNFSDTDENIQLLGTVSIQSDLPDIENDNNVTLWHTRVISSKGNGIISGRVIDSSSNKPIASALIKAMQVFPYRLSEMALTNASGEYVITGLVPGTYTVSAELAGYNTRCYQGMAVMGDGGQVMGIDISLMPMPDDGMIAFCRIEGGNETIWLMKADGSRKQQLTQGSVPSISSDGKRVVFVRDGAVWVINIDGKDEHKITSSGHVNSSSFAPDGRQVVFCENDAVCIINTDGTGRRQLITGKVSSPAFSPDNNQIVFGMDGDVYLMDTDSLKLHRLTNTTEIEYASTFSPDAAKVMFTRCDDSGKIGVWTINRDGGQAQMAANDGFNGRFSPDGKQVVFVSARDGVHAIYIIGRDGGPWKKITTNDTISTHPSWGCSPLPARVCIWPGDTNNDGYVNERDIFPIAIYWGKHRMQDAEKDSGQNSISWQGRLSIAWDDAIATYADANGDGWVNGSDILPIGMNWGRIHEVSGSMHAPSLQPEEYGRYTEIYRSMYDMLTNTPQTDGVIQLKQALQGFIMTGNNHDTTNTPSQSSLMQNYPNPFNPECWIPYELGESTHVVIRIYNISGQLIRVLDEGVKDAGRYINRNMSAHWDGRNEDRDEVASGVYFYQLQANDQVMTKKMVVLK